MVVMQKNVLMWPEAGAVAERWVAGTPVLLGVELAEALLAHQVAILSLVVKHTSPPPPPPPPHHPPFLHPRHHSGRARWVLAVKHAYPRLAVCIGIQDDAANLVTGLDIYKGFSHHRHLLDKVVAPCDRFGAAFQ